MEGSSLSFCVLLLTCPSVFILPPSQDSAIVIESFKSGFEPPGDFPFEDFSQNLSRTGSDGTISNTPKGERDKDGAPGSRTDPKPPMSRAKNKLWLFGKKPKVQRVRGAYSFVAYLSNGLKVPENWLKRTDCTVNTYTSSSRPKTLSLLCLYTHLKVFPKNRNDKQCLEWMSVWINLLSISFSHNCVCECMRWQPLLERYW